MKLDKTPQQNLTELLRISNSIVESFGQLPLYAAPSRPLSSKRRKGPENPLKATTKSPAPSGETIDASSSFHISIGWTLKAPSQSMIEMLHNTNHETEALKVDVRTVKVKIGNNITTVPLASKVETSNNIIEK